MKSVKPSNNQTQPSIETNKHGKLQVSGPDGVRSLGYYLKDLPPGTTLQIGNRSFVIKGASKTDDKP